MSRVSFAISICFVSGWYFRVRILCSLSASLMMMTRISLAMARNIFLRLSAWNSILSP